MIFHWDEEKNRRLKRERHISFEQILAAIESGDIIDIMEHPDKARYPGQIVILVDINDYIYAVPTAVQAGEYSMKTAYPSRKYTAKYLRKKGR